MAADELLASIPKLLDARDAAALVELEDHADKKVRKAARKAVHQLRSRGVEIPEKGARSWSSGGLDELRGDLSARGTVDVRSVPGGTRLVLSLADEEEGGTLFVGIVGPEGRMLDFAAYMQTDGQRQRMIKDWDRLNEGRAVPAEWVRQRLRHSREATLALGHSVPPRLDDVLTRLGEAPEAAPRSFLVETLADQTPSETGVDDLLRDAGAVRWPLMFDGNALFKRLGENTGDADAGDKDDAAKLEEIRKAASEDAEVRRGLSGPVANALDDAAIELWLEGKAAEAKRLVDMAAELRGSDAAETIDWAPQLLRFQITSVAMQQIAAQGGLGGHDHDHDHPAHGEPGHVHGPDCDH